MNTGEKLIVADIGGTNGRFALAGAADPACGLEQIRIYDNRQYTGISDLLSRYLMDLQGEAPTSAVLAIAGPGDGSRGRMVKLDWQFDAAELRRTCALERVVLINDFAAMAMGVPGLAAGERQCLHEGHRGDGNISVCGPGTGFGVALLVPTAAGYIPVSTEGGHVAFSPGSELEQRLQRFIAPDAGFVPVENILSGNGFSCIYRFLQQERGEPAADVSPAEIGAAALAGEPLCREVALLFLAVLGATLGDFALAHGATGGMYIAGGIAPRFAGLIPESELLQRYLHKGPLSDYMARVPLHLVTADHVALRGAAAYYRQSLG